FSCRLEDDRCRIRADLLQSKTQLEEIDRENSRQRRTLLKCLDTDLLVRVIRKQEKATRKVEELDRQGRQATTTVNAFELFYGASKSRMVEENVREASRLLSRLEVLPLSMSSAERAGLLFGGLELKGLPIEFRDSMIAGIALEHRLTLVTRNRRDYGRVPRLTIEEW